MRAQHLFRLRPLAGWVSNRLRYPGLRCGLRVGLTIRGNFTFGSSVRTGEGTRIELPPASTLASAMVSGSVAASISCRPRARDLYRSGATIQDGCRVYGDVSIGQCCIFAPNAFVSSSTQVFGAFPYCPIQEQETLAPAAANPHSRRLLVRHQRCDHLGVSVGRGCVVGANSIVTGDPPPYRVAADNPALVLRKRLEVSPKARIEADNEHDSLYFYDGFDLMQPVGAAWTATGGFTHALAHVNPRALRLAISGNGSVRFAGATHGIRLASSVVEFDLAGCEESLLFLHLHADGRCQVRWAELV
jgi:acetyltransferase-like isoleucine patch superfamily enzyme